MGNEEKKNWFRRHWILSIILGIFVLGIIVGMISPEESEQTGDSSETSQQTLFSIGESFIVDDVAFKVNKISTKSEIGEYILDTLLGEEADGIFYVVDLTLENKAQESKDIFMEQFKIIDSQGRKFDYDAVAEIYYDEEGKKAIMFGQQLQPGLPISGVKIFDLPETAEGLKLEITCCGFLSETVEVDLGV